MPFLELNLSWDFMKILFTVALYVHLDFLISIFNRTLRTHVFHRKSGRFSSETLTQECILISLLSV